MHPVKTGATLNALHCVNTTHIETTTAPLFSILYFFCQKLYGNHIAIRNCPTMFFQSENKNDYYIGFLNVLHMTDN